ncbi:hypothetical protein [Photorhabdus bodei]|nr:hypothetical protein [Photorhabdus bodei]
MFIVVGMKVEWVVVVIVHRYQGDKELPIKPNKNQMIKSGKNNG